MKKRKKLPPLDENPVFQALLKDLRRQTPDQLGRLQSMLDERIRGGTDDAQNGATSSNRQKA